MSGRFDQTMGRFQKYVRGKHWCEPFRRRADVKDCVRRWRQLVGQLEVGEELSKEEAEELEGLPAAISSNCRYCREKGYRKGHLDGCDSSSCTWTKNPRPKRRKTSR